MCIIAYKPAGKAITKKTFRTCFENNPDGAGFMLPCEEKVLIRKGYFTFDAFWGAWEKTLKVHGDGLPVVFHFRIATAGLVDKTNCHPHRIKQDLAFVHNGILSCVEVPKKSRKSDTILYRDMYLRDLCSHDVGEDSLFQLIGDHIGLYNKFVFMNGAGDVAFANEACGVWDNGVWYSNAGYLPKFTVFPKGGYGKLSDDSDWWDVWRNCEFCGKELDSPEEQAEGLCHCCMAHEEEQYGECGGCYKSLVTPAHERMGWCDSCGEEIYGQDWFTMLANMEEEVTQ